MGIYQKSIKPIGLKSVRFDLDKDNYVNLLEMSAKDLLHYQEIINEGKLPKLQFCHLVLSKSVVDDEGNHLFTDADDVAQNFNIAAKLMWAAEAKVFEISNLPTEKN